MSTTVFLEPRLVGARFEGGTIPLEVLKDLAVLEEMVVEVAKCEFKKDNASRQRVPRGFADGIDLKLTGIEDGSAKPVICLVAASTLLPGFETGTEQYFNRAREQIVRTVAAAENDRDVTEAMSRACLSYFDRLGRSLKEDEFIEFQQENQPPARLTRQARHRLVQASQVREYTEEVTVRGVVPEADQADMTFEVQLATGKKVGGPMPDQHRETIIEAFNGYTDGTKIMVHGIGKYDWQDKLVSLDTIEHVTILDPRDVSARLDEFRTLKNGWLEGIGVPPSSQGLDWLSNQFSRLYPDDLALPYAYPLEDGGVLLEWPFGQGEASLDIDVAQRTAEWHWLNTSTGEESERQFDLSREEQWGELCRLIREQEGRTA